MENYATVIIEKKRLSSLQETINIGKRVMEIKFAAYDKKSKEFEDANNMNTATKESCPHDIGIPEKN